MKDNAVAGKPSVTKFTHNNYILLKPSGIPINDVMKMDITSPILDDIIYLINAFIFAYIDLPSSIAEIIVEKLSSINIISDASLATSVPCIPIAIPIDAYFKAGASFTPSPVIATISSSLFIAETISLLCAGVVLAKINDYFLSINLFKILDNSSTLKLSKSSPK